MKKNQQRLQTWDASDIPSLYLLTIHYIKIMDHRMKGQTYAKVINIQDQEYWRQSPIFTRQLTQPWSIQIASGNFQVQLYTKAKKKMVFIGSEKLDINKDQINFYSDDDNPRFLWQIHYSIEPNSVAENKDSGKIKKNNNHFTEQSIFSKDLDISAISNHNLSVERMGYHYDVSKNESNDQIIDELGGLDKICEESKDDSIENKLYSKMYDTSLITENNLDLENSNQNQRQSHENNGRLIDEPNNKKSFRETSLKNNQKLADEQNPQIFENSKEIPKNNNKLTKAQNSKENLNQKKTSLKNNEKLTSLQSPKKSQNYIEAPKNDQRPISIQNTNNFQNSRQTPKSQRRLIEIQNKKQKQQCNQNKNQEKDNNKQSGQIQSKQNSIEKNKQIQQIQHEKLTINDESVNGPKKEGLMTTKQKWFKQKFNNCLDIQKKRKQIKIMRQQTKSIKPTINQKIFFSPDNSIRQRIRLLRQLQFQKPLNPSQVLLQVKNQNNSSPEKIAKLTLNQHNSSLQNWDTEIKLPNQGSILITVISDKKLCFGCIGQEEQTLGSCDMYSQNGQFQGFVRFKCILSENISIQTQQLIDKMQAITEVQKQQTLNKQIKQKKTEQLFLNEEKISNPQQGLKPRLITKIDQKIDKQSIGNQINSSFSHRKKFIKLKNRDQNQSSLQKNSQNDNSSSNFNKNQKSQLISDLGNVFIDQKEKKSQYLQQSPTNTRISSPKQRINPGSLISSSMLTKLIKRQIWNKKINGSSQMEQLNLKQKQLNQQQQESFYMKLERSNTHSIPKMQRQFDLYSNRKYTEQINVIQPKKVQAYDVQSEQHSLRQQDNRNKNNSSKLETLNQSNHSGSLHLQISRKDQTEQIQNNQNPNSRYNIYHRSQLGIRKSLVNFKIESVALEMYKPIESCKFLKFFIEGYQPYITETSFEVHYPFWKGRGYFFQKVSEFAILQIQLYSKTGDIENFQGSSKIYLAQLSIEKFNKTGNQTHSIKHYIRDLNRSQVGVMVLSYQFVEKSSKSLSKYNQSSLRSQFTRQNGIQHYTNSHNKSSKKKKFKRVHMLTQNESAQEKQRIKKNKQLKKIDQFQYKLHESIIQKNQTNKKYEGRNIIIPKARKQIAENPIKIKKRQQPGPGSYQIMSSFARYSHTQ